MTSVNYDLLIHGGTVVDPVMSLNSRRDVAITNGRVVAVEADLPRSAASRLLDATNKLVLPGLIDLHTHVFRGVGIGCDVDRDCLARGTTTVVDGGSAGSCSFGGLNEFIVKPSHCRVLAWLNLSSMGIVDLRVGELLNLVHGDVDAAIQTIEANRDTIVGIKVRVSPYVVGHTSIPALRLARQVCDAARVPMMLHTTDSAEPLSEILAYCKSGDVITHCFSGGHNGIFDAEANVYQAVRDAQSDGIIFDIGHGRGGFSFAAARRALEQGFLPDTLSTDITLYAAVDPRFHMPTVMSKLMALGVTVERAVEMATSRPANVLRMSNSIGTLQPGASGDASVVELIEGAATFRDGRGQSVVASRRLRPFATVRAGEVWQRDSSEESTAEPVEWMSHATVPTYSSRTGSRE